MVKRITISVRDYTYDQIILPLKTSKVNISEYLEGIILTNAGKDNAEGQTAALKKVIEDLTRQNNELRNKLNTRNALTEERIKLKEEKAAKDKAAAWAKMKHRSLVKSGIIKELIK